MSFLQRLFMAIFPRSWAESMEADTRTWKVQCGCGFARSLWDLGGIRWKTVGRPRTRTYLRCPQCGRRSWHAVVREPPQSTPAPAA